MHYETTAKGFHMYACVFLTYNEGLGRGQQVADSVKGFAIFIKQ